ncbi:GmrSD restriction endonuclease domain-containing protein [Rhodococcoides fascians]|uniref:GmrSD restriction endonuclease domain-containing protein n=1 Tax=Rhodococcoides fascians TaxID=1828 RepID=UPI00055F30EC|nr:DUF262 domain-containing protein [Rhodococcus fascians]
MDATPHTVRTLFGADECLVVPIFQRPYVWTREKNWEPLWDDVLSMYTLFKNDQDANPHFMGAVVLDHMRIAKGAMPSRQVVDGQQRLTTLQVLFCAVRDALTSRDQDARFRRALTQLSRNQDELSGDRHAKYKVWPTLSDREAFSDIIDAETSDDIDELLSRPHDTSTLLDAYRYFYEATLAWFDSIDEEFEREINHLVTVLREGLQLVVINLSEHDNAQVIFESLNDRGTPLLPSDLIKNFVFQLLESHGYDAEQMHSSYWHQLETPFWKKEIRQGRLLRSRLDAFFSHYLTMRLGKEVLAPSLFTQFREMATALSRDGLGELVSDISRYAAVYERITQSADEHDESRFYSVVAALDTSVLTPVLMYLSSEATADARAEAHRVLESWLVRRHVCKLTSKNYNRLMLDLLQTMKKSDAPAGEAVRDFLLAQTADSSFWPDDERVQDVLLTRPVYRLLTRARLHIVLVGCEQALRQETQKISHTAGQRLSLEKLATPDSFTNDDSDQDGKAAPSSLFDSLGNLSLVTAKLDSATAGGPWYRRREKLERDSSIALNHELPPKFGHEEILERGVKLAEAFCLTWSHPLSAVPELSAQVQSDPSEDAGLESRGAVPPARPTQKATQQSAPEVKLPVVPHATIRPTPAMMPVFSSAASSPDLDQADDRLVSQLRSAIEGIFTDLPIGTLLTGAEIEKRVLETSDFDRIDPSVLEGAVHGPPLHGVELLNSPTLLLEKIYVPANHHQRVNAGNSSPRQSYDPDILALIERGYMMPGDVLVFYQKKAQRNYQARVRRDGTITVGNETFTAVSTALGFCLGYSVNGWQSWRLQRTGELIHDLRLRVLGETH